MKNIFAAALLAGIALTSCKKEYSCVCTYSGSSTGKETQTIIDTKQAAAEKCDEGDMSNNGNIRQCEIE